MGEPESQVSVQTDNLPYKFTLQICFQRKITQCESKIYRKMPILDAPLYHRLSTSLQQPARITFILRTNSKPSKRHFCCY